MEVRLKDIETRLQETHDRFVTSDDWDELEELRETSTTLREESRRLLADIRNAEGVLLGSGEWTMLHYSAILEGRTFAVGK